MSSLESPSWAGYCSSWKKGGGFGEGGILVSWYFKGEVGVG